MILGIDEVGRGPWAGPLVVGAVVLNGASIDGLTDSKALSKVRRETLHQQILGSSASVGLGWVHADELDRLGLSVSLVEATKRAVSQIDVPYHEIIIDGTVNFLKETSKGLYVTTMKKADLLISAVSAASIVAKVARDAYMEEQSMLYPGYGFERHVGYGTAAHRSAIAALGVTPLHRKSFGTLGSVERTNVSATKAATSTAIGNRGEDVACSYLKSKGYDVVERNWKTRLCEIDIVARKDGTVYFVEVKHRKNQTAGGGLAAVTVKKLAQMRFAARLYTQFKRLDAPLRLAVIETTGDMPEVASYVEVE